MAPTPNSGISIKSSEAWPGFKEDQTAWQSRMNIDTDQQLRLVELNHIRYQHADIERAIEFLGDFGFDIAKRTSDTIWFRGYGPHPYAAAQRDGASPIQKLDEAPGGGFLVTIHDPAGFPINLIWGQVSERDGKQKPNIHLNYEKEKYRLGAYQRFKRGPADVYREAVLTMEIV
ncbi:hypothetical protein FANTH_4419 [Fusarium anthophilum]|uniref:VOC domain-containing protein n=1 Tax=Fusarium anthophilum TaxID=48485 RepID=A0A8H5E8B2_9HYPO|nr:hypothetical protein FANTH_4419 [Fusarium anthophilum]